MEEVSPVVIDGPNTEKTKIDVSDQKKVLLKRKRIVPLSYIENPEEKKARIDALREEINKLVRFGKKLVLENRVTLENVEKFGNSSAALNGVIACALEESDLPLSKLVDEVFDKVVEIIGNADGVTKAAVKSIVLSIGHRLCYGVTDTDADVLENEADCALWCWETRDLKLMPKLARMSLKVGRTCRKKIQEKITAVSAMISALEKPEAYQNPSQELMKASERLAKVLNEADILSLMENMSSQKSGSEMAEKEESKREGKLLIKQMEISKKEMEKDRRKMETQEKLLIKQMERSKKEMEKERKKMDRELQKEKLQSEKELKRLHDEAEKEERRREKEEHERQKNLKRQQEEAEKNKKRKEREEADLKKQLALQKQASLMERFLKRNKTNSTSQNDSSKSNTTTSESSSNMIEKSSQSATLAMDSILSQNAGIEEEDIWKSHLNSWRLIGRSTISKRKIHWGIRQKPKTQIVKELKLTTSKELTCDEDSIEKFVDEWGDTDVSGGLSRMNTDCPSGQKRFRSMRLLQFDKSHRPAFYGVWPRKCQIVGARTPFAKDPDIDYEIDSDEEWEEDEPGESLSDCDKDDEDEGLEGRIKGDDDDESEDGFFVPDGYLSENEGMQDDEMESDEYNEEVTNVPSSEQQVQSEEFVTLLQQQKYLNNLTEHALKKNQPLIILNLMHEKTVLFSDQELTGVEKLERMCLQTLSVRSMPGFPNIEITNEGDVVAKDPETSSNKSSITTVGTGVALQDSDSPQIILIIQSCPQSIGKIVESLHMKFPAATKSQLRNKVREIAEFSDNRWQVKKDILSKLGLSISPDKSREKKTSISAFFSKRCLPPSINLKETSPPASQKPASALARPHDD